ncbi:MAG: YraN family protein [Bacteroidaceae bacterium]|nr:YraN family protein [Bacteroidaceae bacterium]
MAAHNDMGHQGEDMAAEYLQQKGYCILDRNWTNKGRKELDIVATNDDIIIFVEVKTRKAGSIATPISAVDDRKQHRIVLAADSYLKSHRIDLPFRFDVIGIVYNAEASRIDHYEDAFRVRPKFYR